MHISVPRQGVRKLHPGTALKPRAQFPIPRAKCSPSAKKRDQGVIFQTPGDGPSPAQIARKSFPKEQKGLNHPGTPRPTVRPPDRRQSLASVPTDAFIGPVSNSGRKAAPVISSIPHWRDWPNLLFCLRYCSMRSIMGLTVKTCLTMRHTQMQSRQAMTAETGDLVDSIINLACLERLSAWGSRGDKR